MTKGEQKAINECVINAIDSMNSEQFTEYISVNRLRSCQAWVKESPRYYILVSYNTIVACIDKETDTLYDFLRYVYWYTATSARHISKFNHDYCRGNWGCAHVFTYRDV